MYINKKDKLDILKKYKVLNKLREDKSSLFAI